MKMTINEASMQQLEQQLQQSILSKVRRARSEDGGKLPTSWDDYFDSWWAGADIRSDIVNILLAPAYKQLEQLMGQEASDAAEDAASRLPVRDREKAASELLRGFMAYIQEWTPGEGLPYMDAIFKPILKDLGITGASLGSTSKKLYSDVKGVIAKVKKEHMPKFEEQASAKAKEMAKQAFAKAVAELKKESNESLRERRILDFASFRGR